MKQEIMYNQCVVFLHAHDYMFPIPRIHVMAEYLADIGYEVNVICFRGSENLIERTNNVTVWDAAYGLDYSQENILKRLFIMHGQIRQRILEICTQLNPKIIQISSPLMIPVGLKIKKITQGRLIYDCYEYWTGGALAERKIHSALVYEAIHKLYSKHIDGSIFVYMGNPTIRSFKNPTWITNLPKCNNIPIERNKRLREAHYNQEDFVIGYLGVITGLKGYKNAINCLKYLGENYKLLIVGMFVNKIVEEEIRNHIMNEKLETRVHITGYVPSFSEVLQYASIMDVGLMIAEDTPWQRNTLPAKLIDYMALGIPIIASDIKSYREFINRYECGILIQPKDEKKIAECIQYLHDEDRIRISLGINGKTAFEGNFSENIQLLRLKALYQRLLEK